MPTVTIRVGGHTGQGDARMVKIRTDRWYRFEFKEGSQWSYIVTTAGHTDEDPPRVVAHAKIYLDRSPYIRLKKRIHLWRWVVESFSRTGYNESVARGECISLKGAKILAESVADLFPISSPFIPSDHRR
jgi:hypothetical protein